ncbi:WYL domain-containing protein [Corynebacterium sp.]|uniref:WYL domain-containing protein n=1 Tax=Corynebacterium sp. TaxID=1720 RepID=UPI0026DF8AAD|nr:WYL domain-containing protein [Corynebacterium sp.]MDO5512728.1 hypothetical protein [Corynebacterium sp.]
MTPATTPAMTPAEHLMFALPHLGESFTLDDAAANLRVLDPCGWPVPADRDKLAWQLHDLMVAGRIESDGETFRVPSRELLALSDEGLPDHPVFDVTDWTVDIGEGLSRTAAALTLLAHRLRRSRPQNYPADSLIASAADFLVRSPRFCDAVAAQPEPLDPAFLLAAAGREVAGLWDRAFTSRVGLGAGESALSRLLGWESDAPKLEPVKQALSTDPDRPPATEFAVALGAALPAQWIHDMQALSASELYLYPEFEIRTPIVRAESPVRALGRSYLYVFEASQFAGSRAASDPLLAEYEPQVIGGGLLVTRRDATPLFRSLGIDVVQEGPTLSLQSRIEVARTTLELGEYFTPAEAHILAEAVTLGTGVDIDYRNEAGVETQRTVTNPSLVNRTLLRGYCHLRGEDRMFRLDRILQVRPPG